MATWCRTMALLSSLLFLCATQAQEAVKNVGQLRPELPDFIETDNAPFALPKIQKAPPAAAPQGQNTFVLQDLVFMGNTVFSDSELRALVSELIGTRVSLDKLEYIRSKITQHYIANGYINSGAILPSLTAQNGAISYHIIEGRLNEIIISGDDGLPARFIQERLSAESDRPFNLVTFQEKYQLLLNDPLFAKFDGEFKPGTAPGESILNLAIVRNSPYQLGFQVDNHGSGSTGEAQFSLNGHAMNVFGLADTFSGSVKAKEGSLGGHFAWQLPISANDTRISLQYGFNDSEVIEEQLEVLDIENDFKSADITVSHPIINTLSHSLVLAGNLSVRENAGRLLQIPFSFASGENNGFSRVSAVRVSAQGSIRTVHDVWSGHIRYSHGISAFNATDNDNALPDSDFSSLLIQVQYARILSQNLRLNWRADAQFSNDGLLPLEQFAIGGANSVRGYRENELVRDEGFSTSLQITSAVFDELDFGGQWGNLDAFIFTDFGDGSFKADVQGNAKRLWSAGIGLTWFGVNGWRAEVIYGHTFNAPQIRANRILQDDGIHVRISGVLF